MEPDGIAWIDGATTPLRDAHVPMADRLYLLGDGLFETLRADAGHLFRLQAHRDRLDHGLRVLGWDRKILDAFDDAVDALLGEGSAAGWDPLRIRVQVSAGAFQDVSGLDATARLTAFCRPLHGLPAACYDEGLRLTVAVQTKDSRDPLSNVKQVSYLPHLHAKRSALRAGFDDALLRNEKGDVAEATSANLIAFSKGDLWAPGPQEGALAGVTRAWVLDQAQARRWRIDPVLPFDTMLAADEVWMTNTTGGIVPVVAVDGRKIGDGRPGSMGRELEQEYRALLRGEIAHA